MIAAQSLSLIICTRNRCDSLRSCLNYLSCVDFDPDRWELIIVDNGSRDGTGELIKEFAKGVPFRVTLINQAEPGVSRAKNSGLSLSRGDVIAFTDDDCYVTPEFINEIFDVFQQRDCGCIGGRVLLYDPSDAPETIIESDRTAVLEPFSFVEPGMIHGANMAARRDVFAKIGGFDQRLGPGTSFHSAEDVDFLARASAAGFRIGYFPGPTVFHHHGRKPGRDVEVLRRVYDYGRGAYYSKFLMNRFTRKLYLKHWYWSTRSCIRRGKLFIPAREMIGALHYALHSLVNRIPEERLPGFTFTERAVIDTH